MAAPPENPLPPCPRLAFNCVRETRTFRLTPDVLFAQAQQALTAMNPVEITAEAPARRLRAVFRVLMFRDDFLLAVTAHPQGAALHVRSASRVGAYDLGANRRRVKRFFRQLDALLSEAAVTDRSA